MDKTGRAIVARAEALIGTRFRLHGRDPRHGLDCIGLVLMALDLNQCAVPNGYRVRGGNVCELYRMAVRLGLHRVERASPGDVALVRPSPIQLHLMVATEGGHIHAHAGLGRVVRMPGPSPWPVMATFRARSTQERD